MKRGITLLAMILVFLGNAWATEFYATLTKTLRGHKLNVSAVAFSPDGKILASAGADWRIILWDIPSGEQITVFQGHTDWISDLAFSPNGHLLASAGLDEEIKVWSVKKKRFLFSLKGHKNWVSAVAFTPDGRYLVSGSWDGTIKIWDIATRKEIRTIVSPQGYITDIAISPDGRYIASAGWDKTVIIWDFITGKKIRTLCGHQWYVTCVTFSPDGKLLASGSLDNTIRIWDVESGKCLKILKGHTNAVSALAFSPDGMILASGGWDQVIRIWDTTSWKEIKTLKGHVLAVTSLAFSPDGTFLASGGRDNLVILWNICPTEGYYFAKSPLRIITFTGEEVFLPPGEIVKVSCGVIKEPIYGWIKEGEYYQLYSGDETYVVRQEVPIYAYPGSQETVGTLPAGFILLPQNYMYISTENYVYLKFPKIKGYIKKEILDKLVPVEKRFVLIKPVLSGKEVGTEVKAAYYWPEQNKYYVFYEKGVKWVDADALEEFSVKERGKKFVSLFSIPIYASFLDKKVKGFLSEGEEVTVVFSLKNYPYYYIKTGNLEGFVRKDMLKGYELASEKSLWVKEKSAQVLLSPREGSEVLGYLAPFSEVKVLVKTENFYKIYEKKLRLMGWVHKDNLTGERPDFTPPYLRIVEKSFNGKYLILKGLAGDNIKLDGVFLNNEKLSLTDASDVHFPVKIKDRKFFTVKFYTIEKNRPYVIELKAVDKGKNITLLKVMVKGDKIEQKKSEIFFTFPPKEKSKIISKNFLRFNFVLEDLDKDYVLEPGERVMLKVYLVNFGPSAISNLNLSLKSKSIVSPHKIIIPSLFSGGVFLRSYSFLVKEGVEEGEKELEVCLYKGEGEKLGCYQLKF